MSEGTWPFLRAQGSGRARAGVGGQTSELSEEADEVGSDRGAAARHAPVGCGSQAVAERREVLGAMGGHITCPEGLLSFRA
jgi:hypothetical protein